MFSIQNKRWPFGSIRHWPTMHTTTQWEKKKTVPKREKSHHPSATYLTNTLNERNSIDSKKTPVTPNRKRPTTENPSSCHRRLLSSYWPTSWISTIRFPRQKHGYESLYHSNTGVWIGNYHFARGPFILRKRFSWFHFFHRQTRKSQSTRVD